MCMIAPSWSSEMLTGARALVTSMFTWFYVCTNPIYMVRIVIIVIIVIIHVSSIQISQQYIRFILFCFVDWIGYVYTYNLSFTHPIQYHITSYHV